MITLTKIVDSNTAEQPKFEIELPFDMRKKSRFKAASRCGQELGMMLPRGHILRSGTLLINDEGDSALVLAADEQVSTVTCNDPIALCKAAYHLGNRHVSLQVGDGWLRYQHDHVLDDMVKGLGLAVSVEMAAFEPEDGAYASGGQHHHH